MILGIDLIKYKMMRTTTTDKSSIPISLERKRNEQKKYLANRRKNRNVDW